ncbi:MAG: L-histidine N(alpha)-methyltransferase [Chloroflexi bacterium]|nr:MAG: L-histidine N(alpha)-methyltransferase [Chloroflexota bacterium]
MTLSLAPLTVAVHTIGRSMREELIADVRAGLAVTPKHLSPRWFYDERGSKLFDRITSLPEYYQTRTEMHILQANADSIAETVRPESLVELGAGSCTKSRILIDACRRAGGLTSFTPFDVSDSSLQQAGRQLLDEYSDLIVYCMVGDFADHLAFIPRLGRRLVAFLGSTIGNLELSERRRFYADVRGLLAPGEAFLVGFDLVKNPDELIAAYNDAAGVTADFNRNILGVINRELGADFDPRAFDHVAIYDDELNRIEMHLRARHAQTISIPGAEMEVGFAADETVRTEISCKFTKDGVERQLTEAAMELRAWHVDALSRFAVALAVPV